MCVDGIHLHHKSEDGLLYRLLSERATPDNNLVHQMEDQHAAVHDGLEQIEPVLVRWESEADPALGSELAAIVDSLADTLLVHLDEEELEILPLAARHLSQEEWAALGEADRPR